MWAIRESEPVADELTPDGPQLTPEDRARAQDRLAHTIDVYDRLVLTLSGGSLSLSVVLADRIARTPPVQPWLLYSAWGVLVASLVVQMATHVLAAQSISHRLRTGIDKATVGGGIVAFWMSIGAGVLFLVGVSGLAVFAAINLG